MNIFNDLLQRINKLHSILTTRLDQHTIQRSSEDLSQIISEIYEARYGKRQQIDDGEFADLYLRSVLLSQRLLLLKKP